ncbi:hypothetical protein [Staphylothermus hellenicus]|uniref:Uncharacterized protein n=1 Tax=Staphylothermus hellenicus (strain DSM 12710 / JCM 10830 / BK20S6-10-b1 / P8) TaxID=591019 RepID=D7D946_STAHD|nr:hypothetical protein [Staphylothermus hellenicus]ADI32292.1 hypothetical protein Shell_1192 [Staphylothermus hellenicus DSM 12710]
MFNIDDDNYAKQYAYLYNKGLKHVEIASVLQIPSSTLSRKIKNYFRNGILLEYYNVFIDKLILDSWIYIIILSQRTKLSKCFKKNIPKPTITYYSPLPRPTYILYYLSYKSSRPENPEPISMLDIDLSLCRVKVYGAIKETIIPRENYINKKINLTHTIRSKNQEVSGIDDIDDYIGRLFYLVSNPPLKNYKLRNLVEEIFSKNSTLHIFRNHYYKRLYKAIIYKRIVYRRYPRVYAIIQTTLSGSLLNLESMLNDMLNKGLLIGVDQVNVISYEPLILILHAWIDPDIVWNNDIVLDYLPNIFYDIYVVKQIL